MDPDLKKLDEASKGFPSESHCFQPPVDWEGVEELNNLERDSKNCLYGLTVNICKTFKACNKDFNPIAQLPQRVLTQPSEGVLNNGMDNSESNLVCKVHDELLSDHNSYTILDILGTGTFGQVFRCKNEKTKELVAIKVIKNKPAYHNQGMIEIKIARLLNSQYDPNNEKNIVRLMESFEYKNHICLVFEILSISLLDLLTQNQFRGLPLSIVHKFTKQILTALIVLEDANVIHCDLKPENILLVPKSKKADKNTNQDLDKSCHSTKSVESTDAPTTQKKSDVKIIDFGSACFEGHTIYSYIQSRFYRSPEVLLGAPYTGSIDMWSLGCVCAEMYLGLPLFPGVSQHNQLFRIVEMLGVPPDFLIESKNGLKYFTVDNNASVSLKEDSSQATNPASRLFGSTTSKYRIKTAEEYAAETKTEVPVLKRYLKYSKLDEIIMKNALPNKHKLTNEQKALEMQRRQCFVDFLRGLFKLNPLERWTAKQAFEHPFIKNSPFVESFQPPADLKLQERKLMFMLSMQQRQTVIEENKQQSTNGIKGIRAPSNFKSNQPAFTPLQYSHRRLSEPIDTSTKQPNTTANPISAASSKEMNTNQNPPKKTAENSKVEKATDESGFDSSERPMLKRGAPVHMNNNSETKINPNSQSNHSIPEDKSINNQAQPPSPGSKNRQKGHRPSWDGKNDPSKIQNLSQGSYQSNSYTGSNSWTQSHNIPIQYGSPQFQNIQNQMYPQNQIPSFALPPQAGYYTNGMVNYPPPPMMPNMIPQAMPFYNGNDMSNTAQIYPIPVEVDPSYFNPGSYPSNSYPVGSLPSGSYAPSSYGVFSNSHIQDGMQLYRPDLDEQRFLSVSNNYPSYWPVNPSQQPPMVYYGNNNVQSGNIYPATYAPGHNMAFSYDSKGANNNSNSNNNNKLPGSTRQGVHDSPKVSGMNTYSQHHQHNNQHNNRSHQKSHSKHPHTNTNGHTLSQTPQEKELPTPPEQTNHQNVLSASSSEIRPSVSSADRESGISIDEGSEDLSCPSPDKSITQVEGERRQSSSAADALAGWDPFFESSD